MGHDLRLMEGLDLTADLYHTPSRCIMQIENQASRPMYCVDEELTSTHVQPTAVPSHMLERKMLNTATL